MPGAYVSIVEVEAIEDTEGSEKERRGWEERSLRVKDT